MVEYNAAYVKSSGFTSAKWLIPGPTRKPIAKAQVSMYIIYVFSELFGFLTW